VDCEKGHEWYSHFIFSFLRAIGLIGQVYIIYDTEKDSLFNLEKAKKYLIAIFAEQGPFLSMYIGACVISSGGNSEDLKGRKVLFFWGPIIGLILKGLGAISTIGYLFNFHKHKEYGTRFMGQNLALLDLASLQELIGFAGDNSSRAASLAYIFVRDIPILYSALVHSYIGNCTTNPGISYYLLALIVICTVFPSIALFKLSAKPIRKSKEYIFYNRQISSEEQLRVFKKELFELPTRAATVKLTFSGDPIDTSLCCLKGDKIEQQDYYLDTFLSFIPPPEALYFQYLDFSESKLSGYGLQRLSSFNLCLIRLNLSHNVIVDQHYRNILEAFAFNEVLNYLDISDNQLSDMSIPLTAVFLDSRRVQKFILKIDNNPFDKEIAAYLLGPGIIHQKKPEENSTNLAPAKGFYYYGAKGLNFGYSKKSQSDADCEDIIEDFIAENINQNGYYYVESPTNIEKIKVPENEEPVKYIFGFCYGKPFQILLYFLQLVGYLITLVLAMVAVTTYEIDNLAPVCVGAIVLSAIQLGYVVFNAYNLINSSMFRHEIIQFVEYLVDIGLHSTLIAITTITSTNKEIGFAWQIVIAAFICTGTGFYMVIANVYTAYTLIVRLIVRPLVWLIMKLLALCGCIFSLKYYNVKRCAR